MLIINHTRKQIIYNSSFSVNANELKELLFYYFDLINSGKWSLNDEIVINNKIFIIYCDKNGELINEIKEMITYASCELDIENECTCGIVKYQIIKVIL